MLATGHYRNGILLSALTAEAVAALVSDEPVAVVWRPFGPGRFADYQPPQPPETIEPSAPATSQPASAGLPS